MKSRKILVAKTSEPDIINLIKKPLIFFNIFVRFSHEKRVNLIIIKRKKIL